MFRVSTRNAGSGFYLGMLAQGLYPGMRAQSLSPGMRAQGLYLGMWTHSLYLGILAQGLYPGMQALLAFPMIINNGWWSWENYPASSRAATCFCYVLRPSSACSLRVNFSAHDRNNRNMGVKPLHLRQESKVRAHEAWEGSAINQTWEWQRPDRRSENDVAVHPWCHLQLSCWESFIFDTNFYPVLKCVVPDSVSCCIRIWKKTGFACCGILPIYYQSI